MKMIIYLFLLFVTTVNNSKTVTGKYIYHTDHYYESIELKNDNSFLHFTRTELSQHETKGNYVIRGDSLILDSYPQRDKIIVRESSTSNLSMSTIAVTDKMGDFIHYHLYLILTDSTIVSLRNQWEKSKANYKKILGFYVVDTKGLKSPVYYTKGKLTNHFTVLFETNRVFENETWQIKDKKILAKGLDGEYKKYYLEK